MTPQKPTRPLWGTVLIWSLALVSLILVLAVVAVYLVSQSRLRAIYPVAARDLELADTGASIARGEHLVRSVAACTLCHGEDLGGSVYADMGPIGIVAGPNLTRGRGGVGARNVRADWVRAIRYGVRADGTSLIMMPSEVFTNMSNADLASIIAYINSLPPVDREMPRSQFKFLGRALLASGRLNILVAPKTHHSTATEDVATSSAIERGRYLADISGCHGCHGFGLSGGQVAGPPGLPPAANLTPTGLGSWSAQDFKRSIRTGRRPDGSAINDFMPWRAYSTMSDDELESLWAYLRSVPPKASGNK
jgi:cytochrome c553